MITSSVEAFASSIPKLNREVAIADAQTSRSDFHLRVWQRELPKLPSELVQEQGWKDDSASWSAYLQYCYQKDEGYRARWRERIPEYGKAFGKALPYDEDEFEVKYLFSGLDLMVVKGNIQKNGGYNPFPDRSLYGDHFRISGNHEIGPFYTGYWEQPKMDPINPTSMLAHALTEENLALAVQTGILAQQGLARICFSQDRIAFNRGWVVIYQAKDLITAGYPLVKFDETPRDADILREWRSLAVDINLARLVVPSTSIPDYENASKGNNYADSYFGEEFLASLPRI